MSEICLFCTEQKICYFVSKIFTSVQHLRIFVSNFFQIFPKHFQNLKNQKANRVQVHPGAKVNFRPTTYYFVTLLATPKSRVHVERISSELWNSFAFHHYKHDMRALPRRFAWHCVYSLFPLSRAESSKT